MSFIKLLWKGGLRALCETNPCELTGTNLRTVAHAMQGDPQDNEHPKPRATFDSTNRALWAPLEWGQELTL